jgi:hypothetical protein
MEKRAPFRFFPECRGTCPPSVRARFGRVLGSAPASTDRDLRGFQSFGNLGGLYIRGNVSVGGAFIVVGSKGRRREVAPAIPGTHKVRQYDFRWEPFRPPSPARRQGSLSDTAFIHVNG